MDGLKECREYDQIIACDEMASECCNIKPAKRPSTQQIIDRLNVIKSVEWRPDLCSETLVKECRAPKDNSDEIDYQVICKIEGVTVVPTYHEHTLEVHPMDLRFPSEPNELMPCLLHVTNSTSNFVLFRLMEKSGKSSGYFPRLPMEGIFPPYCTYTLVVFTRYQKIKPDYKVINLILRSGPVAVDGVMHLDERDYILNDKSQNIIMQEKEVTLKDLSGQQEHVTYQVIFVKKFYEILQSIDIDPTRQWIIIGHCSGVGGYSKDVDRVRIWNYHTQRLVDCFRVKPGKGVRFIAGKQLFLVFGHSERLDLYKYDTKEHEIAIRSNIDKNVKSLAVHPTKPCVLLPDYTTDRIILQTWDESWSEIETYFPECSSNTVKLTLFNPQDNNSFVTASSDDIVKAWSVDSGTCRYTLPGEFYYISSLYFFTRDGQQYLLIGSLLGTVEIWDMQELTRAGKLKGLNSPVHSVSAHPSMPVLLTGSKDGAVHLWSSTDYRLQGVIQIGNSGCVKGIICLTGSTRVLIGQEDGAITMIDLCSMNYTKKSMDSSEPPLYTKTRAATSEDIISSSNELLDVHPLELSFAFEPNKSISCSLHLTNNTDAQVAFSLRDKSGAASSFFTNLRQNGVVDPRCTKTLNVEKSKEACFSEERCFDLVLRSSIYWDKLFLPPYNKESLPSYFFEEGKELGHAVHEVTVKAVCSAISENTYEEIEGSEFEVPILDVSPLELQFILGRQEPIMCSLHLTNKTDERVAFRLVSKSKNYYRQYLVKIPLCGIVPSRSTYTLILKLGEQTTKLENGKDQDLVLQSCIRVDKDVVPLTKHSMVDDYLEEAIKLGHAVHKVSPKALLTPIVLREGQRASEIISNNSPYSIRCLDAHPTEPWIITGHDDGTCSIWKHGSQMEQLVHPFKVSEKQVCSVKFIARKQWILAATTKGYINVYNCACVTDVKKIRSFFAHTGRFRSLAVHPIQPYLLSVSDSIIKLWDMDNQCQLKQELEERMDGPVAFHPHDASSFATTSGCKVKVWRTEDLTPSYSLSPRKSRVMCLAFFTRDGVQYLITGLEDSTAKIWDLQKKKCIHTMEDIISPVISVISLPGRPYLVTGSKDGVVHVWSSIDFRLQETAHFAGGGPVLGLAYLMCSRSIVVGQKKTISILNVHNSEIVVIDDEEKIIDNDKLIIADGKDIISGEEVIVGDEEAAESQKNPAIDNEEVIIDHKKINIADEENVIDVEEAAERQNNSTNSRQNYRTAQTGTSTTDKGSRFMAKVRKIFKMCKT